MVFPRNEYLGEGSLVMDRVRTSTFVNASGRALAKASHFDTAFIVEDIPLHKLEGELSGIFLCSTIVTYSDFLFSNSRAWCRSSSTTLQSPPPIRHISSPSGLY